MRLRRWLAMCGVAAAVLVALGAPVVGGSGFPDTNAPAAKVLSHYRAHAGANRLGAFLILIAAVLLVLFAARLREVLLGNDMSAGLLPLAAFGGAVLASAALTLAAVVHLALVSAADDRFPTAARTLNELDHFSFEAIAIGFAALLLAAGISTVRQPVLRCGLVGSRL